MLKSMNPYVRLGMLENDTLWGGTRLYGLYSPWMWGIVRVVKCLTNDKNRIFNVWWDVYNL